MKPLGGLRSAAMTDLRPGENADSVIQGLLRGQLQTLEAATGGDVLAYFGPIIEPVHDLLRVALDALAPKRPQKITVVLETDGGYAEAAERFHRLLRHNYQVVDFVVPGFAMSAGTVLVMSGDAIYMDDSL